MNRLSSFVINMFPNAYGGVSMAKNEVFATAAFIGTTLVVSVASLFVTDFICMKIRKSLLDK